ncbi:prokineticin-2 isoform X2 [Paroedura picta]|uniref:prokineticin-2 isoform X2 n=1 Tax=Paroedura picta TaxID=143630 RepID=UPI004056AF17
MAAPSFITAGAARAPAPLLLTVATARGGKRPSRVSRRRHLRTGESAMRSLGSWAALLLLLLPAGDSAVITGACDRDLQCGGGMCCAVSLWIRSLRMCTPLGNLGEDCHPLSHKVPFWGKRMHHTCPCLPELACVCISPSKYKCLPDFKNEDVFLKQNSL